MKAIVAVAVVALAVISLNAPVAVAANTCPTGISHVHQGFGTGNDLVRMDDITIGNVAAGFANGLVLAPMFGAPDDCLTEIFQRCIQGRTPDQMAAIVRLYLRNNPQEWHQMAAILMFRALIVPCRSQASH